MLLSISHLPLLVARIKKRKNTQGGSGAQPKKGTKGKGMKNNPKDKKPKGKCFH